MRRIDRFDEYMAHANLNDNKVTQQLGLSVGTIGKSRKEGRDLSDRVIEQILNFYTDLNKVWLLTGEGEMLKTSDKKRIPLYDDDVTIGGLNGSVANLPRISRRRGAAYEQNMSCRQFREAATRQNLYCKPMVAPNPAWT